MAGSVNKVILIGRLGRDPEVRTFQNGGKVCNLSLATSETWRDKATGERKERTEWHRVAIFNEKLAEIAEKYLKKGALLHIEGQIETRKWTDQSGVEKYSTEVVLRQFRGELTMLGDNRNSSSSSSENDDAGSYGGGSGHSAQPPGAAHREEFRGGRKSELDDDIPF